MDKYQREQLMSRASSILGEVAVDMAQSDLVEHDTRKYNAMVRELSEQVEKINSLTGQRDGKGFFAKLGDKINGVSAEDRQIDALLVECSRMVRRLEHCKGCLCVDCIRDECKFNCAVCPDGGKVIDCPSEDSGFCIREVDKWYMPFSENGKQSQYEVLCMASNLANGKHYLFLKGRTNDARKVVVYNRLTNSTEPVTDETEYNKVCEAASKLLGY